uniref:Adiponectin receptor protein n=2 Tax=Macrostomum lignano TaxID=282301 RepID=A0A1I8JBE3_9PLAT
MDIKVKINNHTEPDLVIEEAQTNEPVLSTNPDQVEIDDSHDDLATQSKGCRQRSVNTSAEFGESPQQPPPAKSKARAARSSSHAGQHGAMSIRDQLDDLASRAKDGADRIIHVWRQGWRHTAHQGLPDWLKDNDFLVEGHRPQLGTFANCFRSIFRVHTETGNIWTHMLGCIAFTSMAVYFFSRPASQVRLQEKLVFSAFFFGAILCLGFSFLFHTVYCHSERIGRLFNKLDYCGIALLTMGSFVPWLYYGFYCRLVAKVVYLTLIGLLGTAAIVVSMFDEFAKPKFRPFRAGIFIMLGLSGVIPALHFVIADGFYHAVEHVSLGWLSLMAVLYITGAVIYAARFPERLFPGKFDIWLQSHQIFHVFVIVAAIVHFHGILRVANYRLTEGDCLSDDYVTEYS